MITLAGLSASRRASSASGSVPGSTVSTSSPCTSGSPAWLQQPDIAVIPGHHLRRPARRQPHVQVHVGPVEQRIALAQHRHRPPGREMRLDRRRRRREEARDRRAVGRRRARGSSVVTG